MCFGETSGAAVNQCKLSGYLVNDPALHSLDDGLQMAVASLRFAKTSSPVFLVAVGERVRQIDNFRRGDPVAITGKLTVDPTTNQFIILIDVAGPWKMAPDHSGFKYDGAKAGQSVAARFYAMRSQVKGCSRK
jgi:hypothetical protein